jgi:hypothetical protein
VNDLGVINMRASSGSGYPVGHMPPWMQAFWIQTFGMGSDIEPLADMTDWNTVRDFNYKFIVGLFGGQDTAQYCWSGAHLYTIKMSDVAINDLSDASNANWYADWGDVHAATFGSENTSCSNVITDPFYAPSNRWGNVQPALAYAVDHNYPGAQTGWNRLVNASNFSSYGTWGQFDFAVQEWMTFKDVPMWGVVPRNYG